MFSIFIMKHQQHTPSGGAFRRKVLRTSHIRNKGIHEYIIVSGRMNNIIFKARIGQYAKVPMIPNL